MNQEENRYSLPARLLHWLTAVVIVTAFALALSFDDMPLGPHKLRLMNYHKWAGITVLGLVTLRLIWRLLRKPPALPASVKKWEIAVAHATHALLYLLMFSVPMGGWAYSSARGFPVVWMGIVPLPNLMAPDKALAEILKNGHEFAAWVLCALVVLHVLAAIKHRVIDRDTVLQRML